MTFRDRWIMLASVLVLQACGGSGAGSSDGAVADSLSCDSVSARQVEQVEISGYAFRNKAELGQALFSDQNLSFHRSQSCASCHDPGSAFIDRRANDASDGQNVAPASLGDNGTSIGDRNAPTAAYMAFSDTFCHGQRERAPSQQASGIGVYQGYLGGQFWDGRASDLAAQAGGPPLNPDEMGMPDKASVVGRLLENSEYVAVFKALYGDEIFANTEAAYDAMAEAIGEFEFRNREQFYPFSSRYDRSLRGEYQYDPASLAATGKTLFFSSDLTCAACHQLRQSNSDRGEIFSSFEYHNIGVPKNRRLRAINGVAEDFVDLGLALNPAVATGDKTAQEGKFKVPTLRNVALTAPYMHNGVFNTLEAVLSFYEHAKVRARQQGNPALVNTIVNPETNQPFSAPEVDRNIAHDVLAGNDVNLTPERIRALECFLLTLTDARYEAQLDSQKLAQCGI